MAIKRANAGLITIDRVSSWRHKLLHAADTSFAKFALISVGTLATVTLLYIGKGIFVPFFMAILLAQLLVPIVGLLERSIPRVLAVLLAMLAFSAVVAVIFNILSSQIFALQESMPNFQNRFHEITTIIQKHLDSNFGIKLSTPTDMLSKGFEGSVAAGGHIALSAVSSTISTIGEAAIIGIFAYLMLYYRSHFRNQLRSFFSGHDKKTATAVMDSMCHLGQRYLSGMVSVILIIGILDTLGFMLIGAPYPALFGLLGSLAVLIPYAGIAVVAPFCALFAYLQTGSALTGFEVVGVFGVVHFLEGNLITPYVVGNKVGLNPFATILAVVIGGEIWGTQGMVIFIPLIGIVRFVLDVLPGFEPIVKLISSFPPDRAANAKFSKLRLGLSSRRGTPNKRLSRQSIFASLQSLRMNVSHVDEAPKN